MISLNVNYETLKSYRRIFGPHALVFYNEANQQAFQSFDVVVVPVNYVAVFRLAAGDKPETFDQDFPEAHKVDKIV